MDFKKKIASIDPLYAEFDQQDSYECLISLLNILHEELEQNRNSPTLNHPKLLSLLVFKSDKDRNETFKVCENSNFSFINLISDLSMFYFCFIQRNMVRNCGNIIQT